MTSASSKANQPGAAEISLGRLNFVALTGLDSPERQERLAGILAKIDEERLEVVRVAFVDTHAAAIPWAAPGTCWRYRTSALFEYYHGRTNVPGF
jgi:hypothetical protein